MMLSVVIPAYNEAEGIRDIVKRVLATEPALLEVGADALELVVVDDGSTDDTADLAAAHGARVIHHNRNKGYGRALKTGFHHAKGDLLAFLDADGTYPPEELPLLVKGVLDGGELATGSRRSGKKTDMPPARRLGNFFWSHLIRYLTGRPVTDPASGMRVFSKETLLRLYPLPDGLNFTPVMSTRAVSEGVSLKEIPIPYAERVGRSKLGVVSDGFLFLDSIILTAMGYQPGRVLLRLAALGLVPGLAVAVPVGLFRPGALLLLGGLALPGAGLTGLWLLRRVQTDRFHRESFREADALARDR